MKLTKLRKTDPENEENFTMATSFTKQVYQAVKDIPHGRVASYGDIAQIINKPRSARQVGFALRRLGIQEDKIPWWRIINKQGYISINHSLSGMEKSFQKTLLEREGVIVNEKLEVDLNIFHFLA